MPEMPASAKDVFEAARRRPNYRQTYDRFMEEGTQLSGFEPAMLKQEEEILMEALRKTAADPDQYTARDRRELTEMLAEIDAAKELHNQESTMGRKPSKEPKGDFTDAELRNMSLLERATTPPRPRRQESSEPEVRKKAAGPGEEKEADMREARRNELMQSLERFVPSRSRQN